MEFLEAGPILWANQVMLDRLIVDCNGTEVGMIDDLELSDDGDGDGPAWTAILCGPTALGPRIGDRVGTWWLSIGRRLRPGDDPAPIHIPVDCITKLDRRDVRLNITRDEAGTGTLRQWVDEHIVARIPGSGA
jgi:hypothetical protein